MVSLELEAFVVGTKAVGGEQPLRARCRQSRIELSDLEWLVAFGPAAGVGGLVAALAIRSL
jgi:hypothetical protein